MQVGDESGVAESVVKDVNKRKKREKEKNVRSRSGTASGSSGEEARRAGRSNQAGPHASASLECWADMVDCEMGLSERAVGPTYICTSKE